MRLIQVAGKPVLTFVQAEEAVNLSKRPVSLVFLPPLAGDTVSEHRAAAEQAKEIPKKHAPLEASSRLQELLGAAPPPAGFGAKANYLRLHEHEESQLQERWDAVAAVEGQPTNGRVQPLVCAVPPFLAATECGPVARSRCWSTKAPAGWRRNSYCGRSRRHRPPPAGFRCSRAGRWSLGPGRQSCGRRWPGSRRCMT